MSTRPRIRSTKPETWHDEKIGRLSRDGRLLRLVLITFADDEGRFRALPSAILGFGYPYDTDAPRKLGKWMDELAAESLIVLYEHDGVRYGVLPKFTFHQHINKPSPSLLPAPSLNGRGPLPDDSGSQT